jgi:glutathione S-transferase
MTAYPLTVSTLLLALLVYAWAALKVGRARAAYGVKAPAVAGHDAFERVFRAQQNTVEQMLFFVPLLWVAASLWGDMWAAAYGAVWSVGRILFIEGYARAAEKRELGFILSGGLSLIVLLACIATILWRHVAG